MLKSSLKFALLLVLPISSIWAQVPDATKDIRYLGVVTRNAAGEATRSVAVLNAFKKQWACPSTGLHAGSCPGWAIDHVIPRACGGADAVWNMQWLPDQIKSTAGEFSKDRFERRVYGGHAMGKGCP
jgi:hypothetical protein